jgi:hypothetical protein
MTPGEAAELRMLEGGGELAAGVLAEAHQDGAELALAALRQLGDLGCQGA